MCEATYVACGRCDAPASDSVVKRTISYSSECMEQSLDEAGEPTGDYEYGDMEHQNSEDDGYFCSSCDSRFTELDYECVPEECECEECCPSEFPDPNVMVVLCRSRVPAEIRDRVLPASPDLPTEVLTLATDRTVPELAMPRWRALQIQRECPDHGVWVSEHLLPTTVQLSEMPDYPTYEYERIEA